MFTFLITNVGNYLIIIPLVEMATILFIMFSSIEWVNEENEKCGVHLSFVKL